MTNDQLRARIEEVSLFNRMRETLQAAQLQLEHVDAAYPDEATSKTIDKIEAVLRESLHAPTDPVIGREGRG
jgi:hypothetical protein